MNDFKQMREELNKNNIIISDEQIDMFNDYYQLLVDWNDKINLTAITDYEGVLFKHFIDSLSLMKFYELNNKKLIDIGTGAGFPGLPLAIMNSNCNFYLLDSLNKRINFLNEVINNLCLKNVVAIHGRAEDFAFDKSMREKFDFATSRAVANLSTLSEYCLPFVKKGGFFISYKSIQSEEEIANADNALKILGGKIKSIDDYHIFYNDIVNRLVSIEKIKNTSNKYPRKAGVPSKTPL